MPLQEPANDWLTPLPPAVHRLRWAAALGLRAALLGASRGGAQGPLDASLANMGRPEYWERLRAEVVEPLVLELEAEDAAAEGDAARQAQLAVDTAVALGTRPCAHPCCTTIVGAHEADAPRGKLCSGCRRVRYCGPACQKADWRAHKAACRELAARRAE